MLKVYGVVFGGIACLATTYVLLTCAIVGPPHWHTAHPPKYDEAIFQSLTPGATKQEVERWIGSPLWSHLDPETGLDIWSYAGPRRPGRMSGHQLWRVCYFDPGTGLLARTLSETRWNYLD